MTGFRPPDVGVHPSLAYPDYVSTRLRAPARPLFPIAPTISETTGPLFADLVLDPAEADLTRAHGGEAQGQRIRLGGYVRDEDGNPIPRTLIEVWQANSAGRYAHDEDQHDAPLDPHFSGTGRAVTNTNGWYGFLTIRPGAYPWANHHNAWRPAHVHFSLFGPAIATRLVTQMYFEGDPLLAYDPIFQSIPDAAARRRLIAKFDLALTQRGYALGYRFDIVLRGREATPFEDD